MSSLESLYAKLAAGPLKVRAHPEAELLTFLSEWRTAQRVVKWSGRRYGSVLYVLLKLCRYGYVERRTIPGGKKRYEFRKKR